MKSKNAVVANALAEMAKNDEKTYETDFWADPVTEKQFIDGIRDLAGGGGYMHGGFSGQYVKRDLKKLRGPAIKAGGRIADEWRKAASSVGLNSSVLDYSEFKPQDKWDVLDDIEMIQGPDCVEDARKIKPYAQRFGVMKEFNEACKDAGIRV